MRTTNNPYNKKIGLNLANNFLLENNKDSNYLDLIFRNNEREALGRRVLILLLLLEGYSNLDILNYLGCAKDTLNSVKKELVKYKKEDKEPLLKFLRKCYYSQFEVKNRPRTGGSKTISGTKLLFGISQTPNPEDRKVQIPQMTD